MCVQRQQAKEKGIKLYAKFSNIGLNDEFDYENEERIGGLYSPIVLTDR